jgi:hypothetical protein
LRKHDLILTDNEVDIMIEGPTLQKQTERERIGTLKPSLLDKLGSMSDYSQLIWVKLPVEMRTGLRMHADSYLPAVVETEFITSEGEARAKGER